MRVSLRLSISGLGIVLYSPFAVAAFPEGKDLLRAEFWEPSDVAKHVTRGDITGFCTGTGGDFELLIDDGPLHEPSVQAAIFKARLCLEVRGGRVCFRDLYDLLDWVAECPEGQSISLPDGYYRITAYTSPPESGILGDNQQVHLHFQKESSLPVVYWAGVPRLCK